MACTSCRQVIYSTFVGHPPVLDVCLRDGAG